MKVRFINCSCDEDYAQSALFFIRNRYDLDQGYTLLDTVTAVYSYLSHGKIINIKNESSGEVIGICAYYYGTPEFDFDDTHTVFVDNVIVARKYRSTGLFVQGFQYLIEQIKQEDKPVEQFQFAALSANGYLRRLYPKFAKHISTVDDGYETKDLYSANLKELKAFISRFIKPSPKV
ncbi:MAG: hypothetical protein K0S39_2164 [Paenibacillus sp.]|nr:hypothetical protein [Paenibacillus sp.]